MKATILIIVSLFCTIVLPAQTYYYNETKTFYEDGYTYQCDKPSWGLITLYNKDNKHTYNETFYYKNDTPVEDTDILWGRTKLLEDDNWTRQTCFSIVNAAFSDAEVQRLKGQKFDVNMTIDSSTGKVIEVDFRFHYTSPAATIPVSTYRKIELDLKEKIWFTPTPVGKQMKVLITGWMHEIKPPMNIDTSITLPRI